ncbi:hypothetical protein COBT_001997 [Conglomerata obtusa]
MPIRGFDSFRTVPQAFTKRPALLLKNEKLIVDGFWYIRKYCFNDPYMQIVASGINVKPIQNLIKVCKKQNTDVLWIWNGLKVRKPSSPTFQATDFTKLGLEELEKGDYVAADIHLKKTLNHEDYVSFITSILRRNGINVIRAPYYAMAQAVYFSQFMTAYFFGPTDYFLFEGTEKIINEFFGTDDEIKHIEIVHKNPIVKFLKLCDYKFQGFCLLLGSDLCPTIPTHANFFDVMKIYELIKGYYSIHEALKSILSNFYKENKYPQNSYLKNYVFAKNVLKFCPVMISGKVRTLCNENLPFDVEEIFGIRVCNYLFEKMFFCEISAEVINGISLGEIKEKNEIGIEIKKCYYEALREKFYFNFKIIYNDKEISLSLNTVQNLEQQKTFNDKTINLQKLKEKSAKEIITYANASVNENKNNTEHLKENVELNNIKEIHNTKQNTINEKSVEKEHQNKHNKLITNNFNFNVSKQIKPEENVIYDNFVLYENINDKVYLQNLMNKINLNAQFTSDLCIEVQILLIVLSNFKNIKSDFVYKILCLNQTKKDNDNDIKNNNTKHKDVICFYNELKYYARIIHNYLDVMNIIAGRNINFQYDFNLYNSFLGYKIISDMETKRIGYKHNFEDMQDNLNFLKKVKIFYEANLEYNKLYQNNLKEINYFLDLFNC